MSEQWYIGGCSDDGSHVDIRQHGRTTLVCMGVPRRAAEVVIEEHNREIAALARPPVAPGDGEPLRSALDHIRTITAPDMEPLLGAQTTTARSAHLIATCALEALAASGTATASPTVSRTEDEATCKRCGGPITEDYVETIEGWGRGTYHVVCVPPGMLMRTVLAAPAPEDGRGE